MVYLDFYNEDMTRKFREFEISDTYPDIVYFALGLGLFNKSKPEFYSRIPGTCGYILIENILINPVN